MGSHFDEALYCIALAQFLDDDIPASEATLASLLASRPRHSAALRLRQCHAARRLEKRKEPCRMCRLAPQLLQARSLASLRSHSARLPRVASGIEPTTNDKQGGGALGIGVLAATAPRAIRNAARHIEHQNLGRGAAAHR